MPVTLSRVSTALAWGCLIFQSAVRSQENPDIFQGKRSSHIVLTVTMALLWSDHDILSRTYGVLVGAGFSRRFHCAHNDCTALSLCLLCSDGVLKSL